MLYLIEIKKIYIKGILKSIRIKAIGDLSDSIGLGIYSKYHAAKVRKIRPKKSNKMNSSHLELADLGPRKGK